MQIPGHSLIWSAVCLESCFFKKNPGDSETDDLSAALKPEILE